MDELAIKTLAVYETISDPRIQSFNDLISISRGERPNSIEIHTNKKPTVGIGPYAPGKLTGPLVPTAHNREWVAYVALTASLASSALEIVQDKLRSLNKPNKRVSYYLEEGNSENLQNFFRYDEYDHLERNYFSYRELALRPLSCFLIASPDINDEGKRITQEILKDKEVLEMIKLQFSTITVNYRFKTEIYLNFRDYLIHNCWSRGIAIIFDELSAKDQYDVFSRSLKKYGKFYYYCNNNYRRSAIGFQIIHQVIDYFDDPKALKNLSDLDQLSISEQELTRSVARTLINIVSVPEYLDNPNYYESSN